MSMAQQAAIDALQAKVADLEAELAALHAALKDIEAWIAARKPGPKPHG